MGTRIISVIGALNYDLIMVVNRMPDKGEILHAHSYSEALGGQGANTAIAAYRACHSNPLAIKATVEGPKDLSGDLQATLKPTTAEKNKDEDIQVRMIGAVGEDEYAASFQTELKKNSVDTSGIITIPGTRTGICFVIVEHYGGESRVFLTLGANGAWKVEDFLKVQDLAHGPRPDLVVAQMEIHKEVVQQAIETAGKAGIDFLLSASPASPITLRTYRYLTHLLANESEAAILSGRDLEEVNRETWAEIAQEFLEHGVKNVVLTLGAKGAYYATATECGHIPAYKVDVVDTTGAGCTFTGTYAAEYLRQKQAGHWDIKSAIVRACKAAALNIGKMGSQEGIPWADEIDRFEADLNKITTTATVLSALDIDDLQGESPVAKTTRDRSTTREKAAEGNEENL